MKNIGYFCTGVAHALIPFLAVTVTVGLCRSGNAQQPPKVPVIGFLEGATIAESQGIEPFRRGLREFGYVEGQNARLEIRAFGGKLDRVSDAVAELVTQKVDIIFSAFGTGALAAKKATTTIPIVFVTGDPIAQGLVSSLAKPGGNVTGLSNLVELAGKRLEIIKEIFPKMGVVAVFWFPISTVSPTLRELETAASGQNVKLHLLETRGPEDFEGAFRSALNAGAGAAIPLRSPMLVNHRKEFLRLAEMHRLPAIYDDKNLVEPGGLLSYGTDRADLYRRAAIYVVRILKGAKPADLPVEQPTKFELVVNLKTAKQIGVTIPPNVLARADRVIR